MVTLPPVLERLHGLVVAGNYADALRLLNPLAETDPHKQPLLLYVAAACAYQLHDSPGDRGDSMATALRLLEQAATLTDYPQVHYNLGMIYRHFGRHAEAQARHQCALAGDPTLVAAWTELGAVTAALGQPVDAVDYLRTALRLPATDPAAGTAQSNAALLLGAEWEGWQRSEARLDNPLLTLMPAFPPHFERWQGEPDVALVMACEQGLGDAIQMLRYVPVLQRRCPEVAFWLRPPLVDLVRTQWPGVRLLETDAPWPKDLTHWVSTMSSPALLWPPPDQPYLDGWPEPPRQHHRRIAFAWCGSRSHRNDRNRSTPLAAWAPLLRRPGVEWVAFADGREEELYRYGVDATVTVAQPHTFEGTRQILAGCDAVVSVDTSLGHVAGAMGIPTALLLSADPDSRWGMTGRTTRWYPSVTLCRQSVIGDWASAITQAEEWLT